MLNSDELGEKGEHQFGQICADAKLVCNKSTRDRTGWDYIVEFNFPNLNATRDTLEKREKPLSCHIQVKTIWDHGDRIQMRLSSAEHLAKELKPSFIYVQKVNSNLEFTSAHLIHMLDEPLGKILKRLRKEDIAGTTAANDTEIYMSVSTYGVALEPTGQALRDAIVSACGDDLRKYTERKSEQLKTLGFEERGAYELKLTLKVDKIEDLVDAFLGLNDEVSAEDVRASEIRFGLKKPIDEHSDSSAKISIKPTAADNCTITVRSSPLAKPATFKGEVFFSNLPGLPKEHNKILIKSELFQLTFQRHAWTIATLPHQSPQSLTDWASFWRLSKIMKEGSGTIRIKSEKHPIDITLNIDVQIEGGPDVSMCEFYYETADKAAALFKLAGVNGDPKLKMDELYNSSTSILRLDRLANPSSGKFPLRFTTEPTELKSNPFTIDMLYIDWLTLGNITLGFYGTCSMNGELANNQINWSTENVELKSLTQLYTLPQDLHEFAESAKKQTGCQNVWIRQWDANAPSHDQLDEGDLSVESSA